MTDSLSTAEIKRRSISGTKWLVVMNSLGIPASFLVTLMLGRVGPEALGTYALAQMLIAVITTFAVYGGPPVLSVFVPKLPRREDRGRFMFSYLLIQLFGISTVLALFWLFPGVFGFLLQREFDMGNYGWFVLLALAVSATEVLAATASGLMLIKVTAIARQMMRLILLPLVAVLFFFRRALLIEHAMPIVLGGFLAGYLAAAVISLIGISRDTRFSMRPGWVLPRGFWAFSLSTMAATVFTFLYGNFDRMTVLSIQDVAGLGMYQAVISINHLIDLVPQMLGSTFVPAFSSFLATGDKGAVVKAYDLLQRAGSTFMTLAALFLIAYSHEILALFGEGYASYAYLLAIFCVASSFHSLFFGNTPVLIAYQKNAFRFTVSAVQISIQVIGTLCFIETYGILAIALSKVAGLLFAQAAGICYVVCGMREGFRIPRTYKVGVLITLGVALLRILVLPLGIAFSTIVFVVGLLLFYFVSGVSIHEIRELTRAVLDRKGCQDGVAPIRNTTDENSDDT